MSKPINKQRIVVVNAKTTDILRAWCEHPYSLTDKLYAMKGSTDLELISQKWTSCSWWDKYVLQIDDDRIFERQILMKHQQTLCWYARTIIPKKCYNSNPELFKRLEKESVRNLIFDNADVHRVAMFHYPVDKRCIEFNWVKKYLNKSDSIIWVRLAEYSLNSLASFYLAELLLPELESIS